MLTTTTTTKEIRKQFEQQFQPSNEVLPESDQDIIRDILSTSQRTVEFINSELFACSLESEALTTQREKEVARMERLRTGIASHKRVPHEILLLIFVNTLDGMPPQVLWKPNTRCWSIIRRWMKRRVIYKWKPNVSPWNIIQVCAKWRAVALSDMQLWRTMTLLTYPYAGNCVPVVHPQTSKFLERLVVQLNPHRAHSALFLSPFSHCQNLRDIEMRSVAQLSLNAKCMKNFPWTRLTSLTLPLGRMLLLYTFIGLAQRATNLVSIDIALSIFSSPPHCSVEMRSLRSLTIRMQTMDIYFMDRFFSILTVPALETLALFGNPENVLFNEDFPSNLNGLLNRSRCRVRHFTIKDILVRASDTGLYLAALPDLISCNLGTDPCMFVDDPTLDLMNHAGLVPNLETFCARVASLCGLQRLLEVRYAGVSQGENRRMRDVCVKVSPGRGKNEWEEFARFVDRCHSPGRKIVVLEV